MTVLADAQLAKVRETVNKIDTAVLAVQALADREDQEFPNRPRLKGLRRISRQLAGLEAELQGLYS